jgi:hypothetical protein
MSILDLICWLKSCPSMESEHLSLLVLDPEDEGYVAPKRRAHYTTLQPRILYPFRRCVEGPIFGRHPEPAQFSPQSDPATKIRFSMAPFHPGFPTKILTYMSCPFHSLCNDPDSIR